LVVAILTKGYLFGLAVLGFTGSGVVMLVKSAFVASGEWWQNVLVEIRAGRGLVAAGGGGRWLRSR
jgi:hypothetical protein